MRRRTRIDDGPTVAGPRRIDAHIGCGPGFRDVQWLMDLLVGTVLPRVGRIAALLSVGLFLANLAVAFGVVEYVAALSRWPSRRC